MRFPVVPLNVGPSPPAHPHTPAQAYENWIYLAVRWQYNLSVKLGQSEDKSGHLIMPAQQEKTRASWDKPGHMVTLVIY